MEVAVPMKQIKTKVFFAKIFDISLYIIIQWQIQRNEGMGDVQLQERNTIRPKEARERERGEYRKGTQKGLAPPPHRST